MNNFVLNTTTHLSNTQKFKRLPTWPTISIVLLVTMGAIFPPGLLTGMNLYLLTLAFIVWIASREPFDRNLLRVIAPFGIIIFIGLAMGADAERYLYLKDAWYVSNGAVLISVGYVFYRNKPDLPRGMRAFVVGGTMVAIFYLSKLATHPELFNLNAADLREAAGTGYFAPVLAFSILCAYFKKWPDGLKMKNWAAFACFVICIMAIFASLSRTIILVAVIGVLASLGAFAKRELIRLGGVLLVGISLIVALRLSIDTDSNEATKSFLGKLARSTDELTIQNFDDFRSINLNWRGYETSRALKYYVAGSPLEWMVGYGFGAQVDLGLLMPLGNGPRSERTSVQFVPILHNGFAYLLVKGGAVAVFLFCGVLTWLYQLGRKNASKTTPFFLAESARIMQTVAVSLAFTTYVVAGVFNKLDMFPFLLAAGFLLASLTLQPKASV